MNILSIETSCDETAISIVRASGGKENPSFEVLANKVMTQIDIHKEYGGVYPTLAKREHEKNLPVILDIVMNEAKVDIDHIVVTNGPGLAPALWVGVNFAKELGEKLNVPVWPVNHMEGHILSVMIQGEKTINLNNNFPILSLLISGGHTELVLMKDFYDYEKIGATKDDAIGEAYDKVARVLDLPYPGGPEISKLAKLGKEKYTLPRPMINTPDYDFSFSGIKTAVLYLAKSIGELTDQDKADIAKEFEIATTEVLLKKTFKAIEEHNVNSLIIAGGVAANQYIRDSFKSALEKYDIELLLPSKGLATDNSLMIAIAGYFNILKGEKIEDISADGNLSL